MVSMVMLLPSSYAHRFEFTPPIITDFRRACISKGGEVPSFRIHWYF
jgi:hypothetical protein